ncbi:MAG: prepilin-type N-terminal cleavage/methylation domain-containing protein [Firmicutes bacterium]|nr:prepilin-type N-terminal cleavage/methylation domain-containing protein [Bacillota bacterium]
MKTNQKGFTLAELLAVIVIMCVLALIGIPTVTKYISNSKKSAYITTVKSYVSAVEKAYNSDMLDCSGDVGKFYVDFSDAKKLMENGKSPYGGEIKGNIRINVANNGEPTFSVFSRDDKNTGTSLINANQLNPNQKDIIKKDIPDDYTINEGYVKCVPKS